MVPVLGNAFYQFFAGALPGLRDTEWPDVLLLAQHIINAYKEGFLEALKPLTNWIAEKTRTLNAVDILTWMGKRINEAGILIGTSLGFAITGIFDVLSRNIDKVMSVSMWTGKLVAFLQLWDNTLITGLYVLFSGVFEGLAKSNWSGICLLYTSPSPRD